MEKDEVIRITENEIEYEAPVSGQPESNLVIDVGDLEASAFPTISKPRLYVPIICSVNRKESVVAFAQNEFGNNEVVDVVVKDSPGGLDEQLGENLSRLDWSEYSRLGGCPYCRNTLLVQCGKCKMLNCQGNTRPKGPVTWFKCGKCGNSGYIHGHFNSVLAFKKRKGK